MNNVLASNERDDMARFVQRNVRAYLPVYDALIAGRERWPICWPGVIAPQAWFLYRKMYLCAAVASVLPMLLALIPHVVWTSWGVTVFGALGARLYVVGARRTIAQIRRQARDETEAEALIERAGGVSYVGAAIGLMFAFSGFVLTLKLAHGGAAFQ